MSEVAYGTGFVEEAVLNHRDDAVVDAVEESIARHVDGEEFDVEVARFGGSGAQRRVRDTGLEAYFDGVDEAFVVVEVDLAVVDGVELEERDAELLQTAGIVDVPGVLSDVVGYSWDLVDATSDCVDVHHGAPAKDLGGGFLP